MHPNLSIEKEHLFIEGCDAVALAERFGTPLFVMSEQQLRRNVRDWQVALTAAWPEGEARILPSLKANTSLALRHILSQEGAGCDTFGAHELTAALRGGTRPELISVNGSAKSRPLLRQAIEVGARITLDHADELAVIQELAAALGKTAVVRFRLRLREPHFNKPSDLMPDMPTGELLRMYKPGIPFETAVSLGQTALAMANVDLAGLHIHIARNSSDLDYWVEGIGNLVGMVADLHAAWDGWLPRELDLGGGYSYPYDPAGRGDPRVAEQIEAAALPTPQQYAETLTRGVREAFGKHNLPTAGMALEIEPGRALYGSAGVHLTRVCGIKSEQRPLAWRWIETDTSEIFLSGIGLEHAEFPLVVANKAGVAGRETADIVGVSCNFDLLVSQASLPTMEAGDLIAFLQTGAYEEANGSNFNLLARPAMVLVDGETAAVIRRRETLDEILGRDVVPTHLSE